MNFSALPLFLCDWFVFEISMLYTLILIKEKVIE